MGTNCTVSLAVIVFVVLLGTFTSLSVTVSCAVRCGGGGGGGGGDGESSLLLVLTPSISCDDCSLLFEFVDSFSLSWIFLSGSMLLLSLCLAERRLPSDHCVPSA